MAAARAGFWLGRAEVDVLRAAVADRAAPGSLTRDVAAFNVSWSLGKGTGLVVGGLVTEALQPPS